MKTHTRFDNIVRIVIGSCLLTTVMGLPVHAEVEFRAEGVTEPMVDEMLSTMVRGMVAEIPVEEGAAVKKGDIVMTLRKKLEELEVERRKLVWESKVELESAGDRLETVKLDLDATRRLYHTTKSISKEKLLEKELEFKLAESEVERLKVGEDLQRIEYEMAQEQLRLREIRSPIDGSITEIFLHIGENAEPGQPLVRVVETKRCIFTSNIEARAARALKEGDKVGLLIEAGENPVACEGTISLVSPVVDPASGLQEIKVTFDNANGEVRPGVAGAMTVKK